ncbi:MAG: sodium:proton antiporter [Saprospiraceae bacterium]|nr:MAG: sodium:proton antiporter [Saprospiraceae bacterium]
MLELAGIIILGILAQWLAWRIRVPAILPLILFGLVAGPISSLWRPDGSKWLEPLYDAERGTGLFPDEYLFYFVSLAIGVILFEGGLTLKKREISKVGPVILKLITIGSLTTFIGAGLAAHFIVGLNWPIAFLFGGLVIVTGPTVIAPILQNVPLTPNVATVLKWEGILIDPIGALVAVLVFEFILSADGGVAFTSHAAISFFRIILIGLALGTMAAFALYQLIKYSLVPHYLLNVFTLALVLGVFVFSDALAKESGLLSVVVMGTVLGNLEVPRLNEILYFKESISVLLISILFILLAANINMEELQLIVRDWRGPALFCFIALILRPIGVFISTQNSGLNFREKLFISWVGPRGIVAAGIASLFGITLTKRGVPDAEFITPLVFMIVLGMVLLNATTARPVARLLKVIQEKSAGILLIGANIAARILAKYLQDNGRHVVLVDNNATSVKKAQKMGLNAFETNIYTDNLSDQFELLDMGYLVAMTSSQEINEEAVKKYRKIFGENGTYRLISPEELKENHLELPQQGIFSYTDDFLNLNEVARDYPQINEIPIESQEELKDFIRQINENKDCIPLYYKEPIGELHFLPADLSTIAVEPGTQLVYLGKNIDFKVQVQESITGGM